MHRRKFDTDAQIAALALRLDAEVHNALQKAPSSVGSMPLDPDEEPDDADEAIIQKRIEVIRSERKASVSLLQRRLKLVDGRAARLMDELEDRGIVGPSKSLSENSEGSCGEDFWRWPRR